jgi:trigger factor
LLETSDERTPEQLEEDYPRILEDLKFHIAKQKIVEENELKVEYQDIEALAAEVAKAQFAQYGMTNLPADVLQNYTKSLLEKEETVQNLVERATEDKVIDWLKANVSVMEKEIYSKEFNELMGEHSHTHHEEVADEAETAEPSEE